MLEMKDEKFCEWANDSHLEAEILKRQHAWEQMSLFLWLKIATDLGVAMVDSRRTPS
jgi:hypothetical protein